MHAKAFISHHSRVGGIEWISTSTKAGVETNYRAVSIEMSKEEVICDAFISDLIFNTMLVATWEQMFDLTTASDQIRVVKQDQKSSESYTTLEKYL